MSRLRIFDEDHPDRPRLSTSDQGEMAAELARIGVAFEQWQAAQPVAPGAPSEAVMPGQTRHRVARQVGICKKSTRTHCNRDSFHTRFTPRPEVGAI